MRVKTGEYSLPHIYKFYKARVNNPISYTLFHQICQEYNKEVMKAIMDRSETFQLPYRLGNLWIKKRLMNYTKKKFDFGEYNKTGIKSYHTNDHSDDYICKFHWEKKKCIVKGKTAYCFRPTRDNQRRLAQIIKTKGHKRFFL